MPPRQTILLTDHATVLGVECRLHELPSEFQHALKFADRLNLIVLVGYVEDEKKAYLMTVPQAEP